MKHTKKNRSLGRSIWSAVRLFLRVRPVGVSDAFRFYFGGVTFFLIRLCAPAMLRAGVSWIPGNSMLTVSIEGILAKVRPNSGDLIILAKAQEPGPSSWFKVKPGDIVVDVGAHIGGYTMMAARYASKVVAIEPEPSNFSQLENNIRLNGFSNVVTLRLALSSVVGTARFYIGDEASVDASSIHPEWLSELGRRASRVDEVRCETLDHLARLLGLRHIDWLKIDVEGHELSVLQGARHTLSKTSRLIIEVALQNEEPCLELLTKAGFRQVSMERGAGGRTYNLLLVNDLRYANALDTKAQG